MEQDADIRKSVISGSCKTPLSVNAIVFGIKLGEYHCTGTVKKEEISTLGRESFIDTLPLAMTNILSDFVQLMTCSGSTIKVPFP